MASPRTTTSKTLTPVRAAGVVPQKEVDDSLAALRKQPGNEAGTKVTGSEGQGGG